MKVLLRDINTKLYMNSGDWIEDPENAHDFGRGDAALQYVAANQLTNVEIVHAFSDPQYDFSMGPIDFPGRNEPD